MNTKSEKAKFRIVKPIGGFHGVSAIFPKFKDIIDYEEKKIKINRGYPRFVTHPIVKKIENSYKKKFNAEKVLSCHSYESAIFLIIDYFFKKGNKIFFDEGLPTKFYKFLNQKFNNTVEKVDNSKADIVILNLENADFQKRLNGKILVCLIGDKFLDWKKSPIKFEIVINHDKENDVGIISFYNSKFAELEILRRHCGLNVSSRKICRGKLITNKRKEYYENKLKKRISDLELTTSNYCFLYPSGMAAIFSSIFSLISSEKSKFIALGSLYVDTIRILEKWPKKLNLSETNFIRDNFEKNLEHNIDDNTAGLIVEIPSNPLIQLIDLEKIVKIAHSRHVKVIVDNTIATPYNFKPFKYGADIVVHSTTKFLNGKNNHIGGVLLTKNKNFAKKIKNFNKLTNLDMDFNDIKTLTRNLKNFEVRMKKINENSKKIAEYLNNHKSIEKVYYPTLENDPNFHLKQKYLKGGSGLISFILKDSNENNAEKFYNNVSQPILKGPSLGSEKTLLCPYVILAHFNDPKEKLKQLGFEFYLMRLSVGIEPVEKIINSLENGLNCLNK